MPVFFPNKNKVRRVKRKSIIAQIILVLLGVELLFIASFTAFTLPTATGRNLQYYFVGQTSKFYAHLSRKVKKGIELYAPSLVPPTKDQLHAVRYSLYVPQIPATIFLGYVFGWPLALIVSAIYLVLGLLGPIVKLYPFAAGAGLDYYSQPSFGYLLGMVAASGCVAYVSRSQRTSLNQLLSLFVGLLCVHTVGLAYLLGICLFSVIHEPVGAQISWTSWVFEEARNFTWYALPYDIIFSLALIGIGFPFRWLVSTLTAPDIGSGEADRDEKLVDFRPFSNNLRH